MAKNNSAHDSRRVVFSECSQLHDYEPHDKDLLKSLSYTREEQDAFGLERALDGLRIKNLIETAPPESVTGDVASRAGDAAAGPPSSLARRANRFRRISS